MDKIQKIKNEKIDKRISLALLSAPIILTLQYFIITLSVTLGYDIQSIIQLFSKIIVGVIFIGVFPWVFMRSNIKIILIYIFVSLVFIFHYIFFPDNRFYLTGLSVDIFFISLLSFTYSMSIKNWEIFNKFVLSSANIIFVIGLIYAALVFLDFFEFNDYSMSLSYYMLLPGVIYLNSLMNNITLKKTCYFILSILIILALGSRGAILCIILFITLKFFLLFRKLTPKKLALGFLLLTITIIFLANVKSIFEYLFSVLYSEFGIYSRSLDMFSSGSIHSSGRDNLYTESINLLEKYPIAGVGLAGDRVHLEGNYVHNVFLEILLNFGLILGLIIIIFYICSIAYSMIVVKKNNEYIIIWLALGLFPLLLSASYISDIEFWILNGLIVSTISNNKV